MYRAVEMFKPLYP